MLNAALLALCASLAQEYDVVMTNGRVVDGTGAPWFVGDVWRDAAIALRGSRRWGC
jgi:N-acyl-D-aspartate/D-glutamate deacylase